MTFVVIAALLNSSIPVLGVALDAIQEYAQKQAEVLNEKGAVEELVTPAPPTWSNAEEARIGNCRLFAEPLLPVGGTTARDNEALLAALDEFKNRKASDDFAALDKFLASHPKSAWRASLLANLGVFLRQNGYFTRALDAWKESWDLTRNQRSGPGKVIAERAGAEFVRLNSNLGRSETVDQVLGELLKRDVDPSVNDLVINAHESLLFMRKSPEKSFLCGPLALSRIRNSQGLSAFPPEINDARSTSNGLRLTDVAQLAADLKMDLQMARRVPGAEVIVPAVVHWKVDHFAAIVGEDQGRYLVQDPTSAGRDLRVTKEALDDEGSGYYLVRAGDLPSGWTHVDEEEGAKVWGRGQTTGFDTQHLKKSDVKVNCAPGAAGMPFYSVHAMMVSLSIEDTPFVYVPSAGPPVNFTLTYNQRDSTQPSTFSYPNTGKLWTFNWFSYAKDNPSVGGQDVTVFLPGGGEETFTYNSTSQTYNTQSSSRATLTKTGSGASATYVVLYPDGSKLAYGQSDGSTSGATTRRVFLTQMVDPENNALTLNWSSPASTTRLTSIQDQAGRSTTITYLGNTSGTPDYYKIWKVADNFSPSRSITLTYSAPAPTGGDTRQLVGITDMGGLSSQFSYDSTGFITAMKTPYGTTTFATGTSATDPMNRWLEVTDPLGQKERTEFRHFDPNNSPIPISDPPNMVPQNLPLPFVNNYLNYRNTFFWNKKAMQQVGGIINNSSYTKAHVYHWLHAGTSSTITSGILESEKAPLENRVWYEYPGQTSTIFEGTSAQPSVVARVMDPAPGQTVGQTQMEQYEYNDFGKVTRHIDPVGRVTWFNYYGNLIDLQEVRQGGANSTSGDLLASFTYDSSYPRLVHEATDASGKKTTYAYTANGKLLSVVNAKNETTSFVYGDSSHLGFLTEMDGPVTGSKVTFTADSRDRLRTVTDSENLSVTYDYDNFDRVTKATYPDNTTEQTIYSKLDPVLVKDRQGQWSGMAYDPLRRLVAAKDSLGQVTKYEWCGCGSLASITDPMGRVTSFERDLQNRVTGKAYPDGSKTTYTFENATSRIKDITDAKGQTARHEYFLDNTLLRVSYPNAAVYTPPVSFTYDPNYSRIATMTDGSGVTTYTYNPITTSPTVGAGRLASESSSFTGSTTAYSYDELARVTGRSIDSVSTSVTYDSLGRMSGVANALGSFTHNYVGTTMRPSSIVYPLNSQEVDFTYFSSSDQQNRERLQTIHNKVSGNTLSKFDYQYDANGRISTWTQQTDSNPSTYYQFQYDSIGQLLTAALANGSPGSPGSAIKQYTYNYDSGGNRSSESLDTGATTTSGYNNLNQLTKRTVGERRLFSGTLGSAGSVTINGVPASTSSTAFSGYASVSSDSNIVVVVATPNNGGNQTVKKYQVTVSATGTPKTMTYDLNGNLVSAVTGSTEDTYEWDGADRLVAINHRTSSAPGTRSEFGYDGLGRRVRIIEKDNTGAVTSEKRYVWSGMEISEERDPANSSLTKRYFAEGVKIGTSKYFYTRDHLGSIRELVDSSGVTRARYDYDPYGRRSANAIASSPVEADFGFTGHFFHAKSGLHLAPFRAYDADTGRWLSPDPIEEEGGLNLYAYVFNDPVNNLDPLGLKDRGWTFWDNPIMNVLTDDHVVNIAAGLGDGVSMGITDHVRDWTGINDQVDHCSGFYKGGMIAGTALGFALPGGAGAKLAGGADRVLIGSAKEGIYRFAGRTGQNYIGQSGQLATRLGRHARVGRIAPGAKPTTWEVLGGKLARERAEQQMINKEGLGNLENIVNPLGGRPELYHYVPTVGEAATVAGGIGAAIGVARSRCDCK